MRLDVGERRLSDGAKSVSLTPKAFDVLVYLVCNNGRLVSKDELLERIWAGSIVDEASISVQIAALRKALHDDSRSPRYIETVARSGYRFVARVIPNASAKLDAAALPRRSIAVLPFTDLSEAKDQEWFADGLVEEIIGMLARIQGLSVSARTSAFAFRGKEQDIKAIGQTRISILNGPSALAAVARNSHCVKAAGEALDGEPASTGV